MGAEMKAIELADCLEEILKGTAIGKDCTAMLRQQAKEISSLKKQINLLSVSREPKIGDRVILLDDESEGVIESLSINGYAAINFDDGCYGNYTRFELISLFAYKESE